MGLRRSLAERLRADFLAGLGIVLPAGLTVMLALWAVDFVDDKALPFLPGWFGEGHVAGLGLLADFQPDLIKLDMKLIRGIEVSREAVRFRWHRLSPFSPPRSSGTVLRQCGPACNESSTLPRSS